MKGMAALAAGMLFGMGLVLSSMVDPEQVLAFLTLSSRWDPALMFVMGAALCVTLPAFALARRRGAPWLRDAFSDPPPARVDARLVGGAALFGLGWGLTGYCPGPALSGVVLLDERALLFAGSYGLVVLLLTLRARRDAGVPGALPDG